MKGSDVVNIFKAFRIDPHAFRYFGIIRFLDLPGYFPQLSNGERDAG